MATGYEQARSVVAALAGDLAAADDVQLELPETGVCSTDFAIAEATSPAKQRSREPMRLAVKSAGGCCG
jgi:hypothetical protein